MTQDVSELLKNNYFIAFYAIAFIFSIIRYRRYFDSNLKYFPIIIAYTLISESLGFIIHEYDEIQIVYVDGYSYYNQLIFNIFYTIFFLYFYYVFLNTLTNSRFLKWVKYGTIIFIIGCAINPLFRDALLYPQMLARSIGSFLLIICVLLYFIELKSKGIILDYRNLLSWISVGLFAFYTFYPFILIIGYFKYELYQKLHARTIHHLLIAVMYSCFILGFLLMRRIQPSEDI